VFYYKRQIYCCYNPYGSHGSQRKSRETTSKKNVRFDLIPEKKEKKVIKNKEIKRKRSKEGKKYKI